MVTGWTIIAALVWISVGVVIGLFIAALLVGVRLDLNGRGDTEYVDE